MLAVVQYCHAHRGAQKVSYLVRRNRISKLQVNALADQDWNIKWKESFKSLRITSKIIIVPPWEEQRVQKGEIVIIINPKMAFGTGHHESTQLVIIALEKWLKQEMQVLDVGTGSGILALLAEKLGADAVIIILSNGQYVGKPLFPSPKKKLGR